MTLRRRDLLLLPPALLLAAPAWAQPGGKLAVEAEGTLPGIAIADALLFIATQMERAGLPWNFATTQPGQKHAPNRVAWRFESEKGHGRMAGSYAVSAEARLYRFTQYERMVFNQVTMKGGLLDPALAPFLIETTHSLLDRVVPLNAR